MKYTVEYTERAERDLYGAFSYIEREAPLNARRWLESMEEAVAGLARFPERCPRARESDALGADVRQLVRGGYRVLFTLTGRSVHILHIRHGRRSDATIDDLSEGGPVR